MFKTKKKTVANDKTKLLSHPLGDLFFDAEKRIFEVRWKHYTEAATDDEFKEFQKLKTIHAQTVKPKFYFCNTKEFLFAMSDEMQEWLDENVMSFWDNIGIEKMAFATSQGHLQQLAVEVAVSENEHPYAISYFATDREAMAWLEV